jgi:hypothetical protein
MSPDSSICMYCCYSPWLLKPFGLCFAEYTVLLDSYFVINFVIIVNMFLCFHIHYWDQSGIACNLQFVSSQLPMGHWWACLVQRLLHLVRLLMLCAMLSKFPMLHCQKMYQCQQVQLIWPCLFQRCALLSLGPDGCAHRWHLLVDLRFYAELGC